MRERIVFIEPQFEESEGSESPTEHTNYTTAFERRTSTLSLGSVASFPEEELSQGRRSSRGSFAGLESPGARELDLDKMDSGSLFEEHVVANELCEFACDCAATDAKYVLAQKRASLDEEEQQFWSPTRVSLGDLADARTWDARDERCSAMTSRLISMAKGVVEFIESEHEVGEEPPGFTKGTMEGTYLHMKEPRVLVHIWGSPESAIAFQQCYNKVWRAIAEYQLHLLRAPIGCMLLLQGLYVSAIVPPVLAAKGPTVQLLPVPADEEIMSEGSDPPSAELNYQVLQLMDALQLPCDDAESLRFDVGADGSRYFIQLEGVRFPRLLQAFPSVLVRSELLRSAQYRDRRSNDDAGSTGGPQRRRSSMSILRRRSSGSSFGSSAMIRRLSSQRGEQQHQHFDFEFDDDAPSFSVVEKFLKKVTIPSFVDELMWAIYPAKHNPGQEGFEAAVAKNIDAFLKATDERLVMPLHNKGINLCLLYSVRVVAQHNAKAYVSDAQRRIAAAIAQGCEMEMYMRTLKMLIRANPERRIHGDVGLQSSIEEVWHLSSTTVNRLNYVTHRVMIGDTRWWKNVLTPAMRAKYKWPVGATLPEPITAFPVRTLLQGALRKFSCRFLRGSKSFQATESSLSGVQPLYAKRLIETMVPPKSKKLEVLALNLWDEARERRHWAEEQSADVESLADDLCFVRLVKRASLGSLTTKQGLGVMRHYLNLLRQQTANRDREQGEEVERFLSVFFRKCDEEESIKKCRASEDAFVVGVDLKKVLKEERNERRKFYALEDSIACEIKEAIADLNNQVRGRLTRRFSRRLVSIPAVEEEARETICCEESRLRTEFLALAVNAEEFRRAWLAREEHQARHQIRANSLFGAEVFQRVLLGGEEDQLWSQLKRCAVLAFEECQRADLTLEAMQTWSQVLTASVVDKQHRLRTSVDCEEKELGSQLKRSAVLAFEEYQRAHLALEARQTWSQVLTASLVDKEHCLHDTMVCEERESWHQVLGLSVLSAEGNERISLSRSEQSSRLAINEERGEVCGLSVENSPQPRVPVSQPGVQLYCRRTVCGSMDGFGPTLLTHTKKQADSAGGMSVPRDSMMYSAFLTLCEKEKAEVVHEKQQRRLPLADYEVSWLSSATSGTVKREPSRPMQRRVKEQHLRRQHAAKAEPSPSTRHQQLPKPPPPMELDIHRRRVEEDERLHATLAALYGIKEKQ